MATHRLPAKFVESRSGRRMSTAWIVSVAFHGLLILFFGLWSFMPQAPEPKFDTVKISFYDPSKQETLPVPPVVVASPDEPKPRYQTQLPAKPVENPVEQTAVRPLKPSNRRPSNTGGPLDRAPAAPNILTAKSGRTPAGPVGHGTATDGPGGKVEDPGGPTYGPNTVGGPLPIYPKRALDEGMEGRVIVTVTINAEGAISDISVAKSSGHQVLDDAAVRAVRKGWTFKPGMSKGKPAAGTVQVVFDFSSGKVTQ